MELLPAPAAISWENQPSEAPEGENHSDLSEEGNQDEGSLRSFSLARTPKPSRNNSHAASPQKHLDRSDLERTSLGALPLASYERDVLFDFVSDDYENEKNLNNSFLNINVTKGDGRLRSRRSAYCVMLDRSAPVDDCVRLGNEEDYSIEGRGSLSTPSQIYRGQSTKVRFVVTAGNDQHAADEVARTTDGIVRPSGPSVRFSRHMMAHLTGEGFEISPSGPVRVDTENSGNATWEWTVTPKRSSRHYLRVEAWTLRNVGGKLVKGKPVFYPPVTIKVPVRFFPERTSDIMDDTANWFDKGTNWFKALGALILAAGAVWAALRAFKRPLGSLPRTPHAITP